MSRAAEGNVGRSAAVSPGMSVLLNHRPAGPAQISIPDFRPSLAERTAAANDAARRWLGVSLILGAPLMVLTALSGDRSSAHAVIPLLWLAGAVVAFAARRLTLSSSHVGAHDAAISQALLFAGIALVGPLTLHGFVHPNLWAPDVWTHFGRSGHDGSFASWMVASFVLTGLSHLVFAALCALRGFMSGRAALCPAELRSNGAERLCSAPLRWRRDTPGVPLRQASASGPFSTRAPSESRHVHDNDEAGQRAPRPGLVAIGVAAAAAALPAVLFSGVWGLLPVLFVAVTSAPLLRLMLALEERRREE